MTSTRPRPISLKPRGCGRTMIGIDNATICLTAVVLPVVLAELKRLLSAGEEAQVRNLQPGSKVVDFPASSLFRRDFAGGQMVQDMTLFVDDGSIAYHFYASENDSTLQISQLTDDYLRPTGKFVRVFPRAFNEAPAVFKHAGKY